MPAMKRYEKRRYEQARACWGSQRYCPPGATRARHDLSANADLHEVLAAPAAAAELGLSRPSCSKEAPKAEPLRRLYLAEALLAHGNAREAAATSSRSAPTGRREPLRAIASIGLGSVLWTQRDAATGARPLVRRGRAAARRRSHWRAPLPRPEPGPWT